VMSTYVSVFFAGVGYAREATGDLLVPDKQRSADLTAVFMSIDLVGSSRGGRTIQPRLRA
jgi:hypothetical protein